MTCCIDADIGADKTVIANADGCFIENGEVEVCKKPLAYADLFAIITSKWLVDDEVIIANLLHAAGIAYRYEEPLHYDGGKILPDFTIYLSNGRKIFWEHVGMLGVEDYDKRWAEKLRVYEKFFPGQLRKTYESCTLSTDAQKIIDELRCLNDGDTNN